MLKLDYRSADEMVIGSENGLNIREKFEQYKSTIANIISDLNKRKAWTVVTVVKFRL